MKLAIRSENKLNFDLRVRPALRLARRYCSLDSVDAFVACAYDFNDGLYLQVHWREPSGYFFLQYSLNIFRALQLL